MDFKIKGNNPSEKFAFLEKTLPRQFRKNFPVKNKSKDFYIVSENLPFSKILFKGTIIKIALNVDGEEKKRIYNCEINNQQDQHYHKIENKKTNALIDVELPVKDGSVVKISCDDKESEIKLGLLIQR